MTITKEEWFRRELRYKRQFRALAERLGKKHAVTQWMGAKAWGRHEWEYGPNETKDDICHAASALEGFWRAVFVWAVSHDHIAQQEMRAIEEAERKVEA